MLVTSVLNNAANPVSATFTSYGGPLLIQFAGSAYAPGVDIGPVRLLEVNLKFNDFPVAKAAVSTNEPSSHKALVPIAVTTTLVGAGQHVVTVEAANSNTIVDGGDHFTVTIFEFGTVDETGAPFEGIAGASAGP
jgi:hypothetical protein